MERSNCRASVGSRAGEGVGDRGRADAARGPDLGDGVQANARGKPTELPGKRVRGGDIHRSRVYER